MKWAALFVIAVLLVPSLATADTILWQQLSDGGGRIAQDFPDRPDVSTWLFDDISVPSPGWVVDKVTVYGQEGGAGGDPSFNQDVLLRLYSAPDLAAPASPPFSGIQSGSDLVFNFPGGVSVPTGTEWLSAWVQRPFAGGGQWYWDTSASANGSEHWFQNPGGYWQAGPAPVAGHVVFGTPSDLAFTIEGHEQGPGSGGTPELPPIALLSALPIGIAWLRRRAKR